MNKQTILEKVATGQDLTPNEVRYLQSVLSDAPAPIQTEEELSFDHTAGNTYAACGINEEDFEVGKQEIAQIIFMNAVICKSKSEIIEKFLTQASPKTKHMFMVRAISDMMR